MVKPKLIRITTVPGSFRGLLKGQLKFMSENKFEVIAISSPEEGLKEIEKNEGVRTVGVLMTRSISPIKDLRAVRKLYKIFKKERPQIVHTHTPKAGVVGMLAAKLAGVPIRLHTVAGLPLMEATGIKRKILDLVEKLTYACATKVYPNSKGLYEFIVSQKYTTPKKIKVIANGSSNGIDASYFNLNKISAKQKEELRVELGISDNDFIFIFVGRLVRDKGINELVEAFIKIKNKQSKLLLVGYFEKELDPLSAKTISEIKNNVNIISVGFQRDVRPYLAIANAFVFPSYREGFPNAVLQAGAMELPIIATNINGCNEIIKDHKSGIIIPVKNTEILRTEMERLVKDKDLYNNLKKEVRKDIVLNYNQKNVWDAILKEYLFYNLKI